MQMARIIRRLCLTLVCLRITYLAEMKASSDVALPPMAAYFGHSYILLLICFGNAIERAVFVPSCLANELLESQHRRLFYLPLQNNHAMEQHRNGMTVIPKASFESRYLQISFKTRNEPSS